MIPNFDPWEELNNPLVPFSFVHGPLHGTVTNLPEYTTNTLTLNINGQVGKYVVGYENKISGETGQLERKLIPHTLFWEPKHLNG